MLCRKPIKVPVKRVFKNRPDKLALFESEGITTFPIPCGKCLACLISKRRQWTLRILLESFFHEKACFVSLTYAPEHMPANAQSLKDGRGVLEKSDLQKFIKRLRIHPNFKDREIRFYACGEYGPRGSHQPHYHIILFGVDAEELDPDWYFNLGRSGPIRKGFIRDSLLYQLWQRKGIVHVGDASSSSIAYCAGYVTSKITKKDDGYTPEFHTMSRRPGLGLKALAHLTRYLQEVSEHHLENRAAPREIRVEGHMWPVGRYLLSKLRRISDLQSSDEEFTASLVASFRRSQQQGVDFLSYLVAEDDQRFKNLEARHENFNQRTKLDAETQQV